MSANSISGERDSQISNLYVLSCAYEALVTRIHQPFVSAESPVPRLSDQVFRFDLSLQTRPSTTAGLARHVRREATRSDVQAWIEGLKGLFARIALRLRRAELMACPSEKVITAHSASIPAVVLARIMHGGRRA